MNKLYVPIGLRHCSGEHDSDLGEEGNKQDQPSHHLGFWRGCRGPRNREPKPILKVLLKPRGECGVCIEESPKGVKYEEKKLQKHAQGTLAFLLRTNQGMCRVQVHEAEQRVISNFQTGQFPEFTESRKTFDLATESPW